MMEMRIVFLGIALCFAAFAGASIQLHGASSQAKAGEAVEITRGQALFSERCAICHYDQSTAQKMGPGLKGIYTRGKFADGKKVDDASMKLWIENGGKDMPGLKDVLKPEQIRVLVSYLKTL